MPWLASDVILCLSLSACELVYADGGKEIRDDYNDEGDLLKHVGIGKIIR